MLEYNQKYVVFDTETEGLNYRYSSPWELSFVEATGNRITNSSQIYIDIPGLDLSDFIIKLTGFNRKKYDSQKISPKEAWEIFKKRLYDEKVYLVGQNIVFYDSWMLVNLARMAGEKFDYSCMDRFIDTRFFALAHKNGLSKPRDGEWLSWYYKLSNDSSIKGRVSQNSLLKEFGIPFEEEKLHDGLYDCEKNWEIFLELKRLMNL